MKLRQCACQNFLLYCESWKSKIFEGRKSYKYLQEYPGVNYPKNVPEKPKLTKYLTENLTENMESTGKCQKLQ